MAEETKREIATKRQREYREQFYASGGKQIGVTLEKEEIDGLDAMVKTMGLRSRSAAAKIAIRTYIDLLKNGGAI